MWTKIIITAGFILALFYAYQNFIINISSSESPVVYKIEGFEHIQKNSLAAVCLSGKDQKIGLANHYLIPGIRCNGTAPLIKTVIAVSGDTVTLKQNEIVVNGRTYQYVTKNFDSAGRVLSIFPPGT